MRILMPIFSVQQLGVLVLCLGCQPQYVDVSATLIELEDIATGNKVEAAAVSATVVIHFGDEIVAPVGPTDGLGRTYVPLERSDNRPFSGVLTVEIAADSGMELLRVANSTGATAAGGKYSVRVIDDMATLPVPLVEPILGSSPPRLRVVGYLASIGVCDNTTGLVTWEISRQLRSTYYFEDAEIAIGNTPSPYSDITRNTIGQTVPCGVVVDSDIHEGLTAFVGAYGRQDFDVASRAFCISTENILVECD